MTGNSSDLFNVAGAFSRNLGPLGEVGLRHPKAWRQPREKTGKGPQEIGSVQHSADIAPEDIALQDNGIKPRYSKPDRRQSQALGGRIREARERLRLRQEDVAGQLKVKQSAVSNWEMGKSTPDLENRIRLSGLLNIPLNELLPEAPNLPPETFNHPQVRRLVENFLALSPQLRRSIELQVLGLREKTGQNDK